MKRPWLVPLVPLYAAGQTLSSLRLDTPLRPIQRLQWPVVSIGNLSTGGAGKTPLTITLAKALALRGLPIDVLSRGYGRRGQRPARVDPDGTAEEFGDEPLLIARQAGVPVYVAGQRFGAGQLAEAEAPAGISSVDLPAVHLLDDGFQHRQLHRDVDILLLDSRDWFEDVLLPAGNLREPIRSARRATVIAIPAPDGAPELEVALRVWGFTGPIWRLHRKMQVPTVDGPVAVFCGIARPEQFFAGIEAAGLRIADRIAFPDHHRFTPADLKRLITAARKTKATALITTEKDQVRLGTLSAHLPESLPLRIVRLRVEIEHEEEAIELLIDQLRSIPRQPTL